jgi:hypothetical protein
LLVKNNRDKAVSGLKIRISWISMFINKEVLRLQRRNQTNSTSTKEKEVSNNDSQATKRMLVVG